MKNLWPGRAGEARGANPISESTALPPLTAKQQVFVEEYLVDLNATQAAIRAGYSKKTARFIGCENLTKPNIAAKIAELQAERARRVGVEADEVLEHLNAIATSSIADYLSFGPKGVVLKDSRGLTDGQSAAIEEVVETMGSKGRRTVTFKLHDKAKAINMAMKHLGLYTAEKQGHSFSDEANAAIDEAIRGIMDGH